MKPADDMGCAGWRWLGRHAVLPWLLVLLLASGYVGVYASRQYQRWVARAHLVGALPKDMEWVVPEVRRVFDGGPGKIYCLDFVGRRADLRAEPAMWIDLGSNRWLTVLWDETGQILLNVGLVVDGKDMLSISAREGEFPVGFYMLPKEGPLVGDKLFDLNFDGIYEMRLRDSWVLRRSESGKWYSTLEWQYPDVASEDQGDRVVYLLGGREMGEGFAGAAKAGSVASAPRKRRRG